MNIKLPKSSTLLFINILIFLSITLFAYSILLENIKINNVKNQEILFFQIKEKSSALLTKVLQKYHKQKELIGNKHMFALTLFEQGLDIDEIKKILNQDFEQEKFEVILLNKDLIIEDSSIFTDIGTNLSLLKKQFEKFESSDNIDVSIPEYSLEYLNFVSYSTSKLKDGRYLQISYSYGKFLDELRDIQEFINSSTIIKKSISYIISNGYVGNFAFKMVPTYKQTIEELENRLKKGNELLEALKGNSYISYYKESKEEKIHIAYLLQDSPIYDDAEILYCIVFDENDYNKDIFYLRLFSFFVFISGATAIYLTYKLRTKELLLNYKDKFIAHSIHEIKTPLSIITINTQLREKLYGSDRYTIKIDGALKTLENSYEDMTFLHTKDKIEYEIIEIDLKRALENRVKYFDTIANCQNRKIELIAYNNLYPTMSKIELNRLVDNNISNAIKYSQIGSTISIILKNNTLEFHSKGAKIENPKEIFKRYKREDKNTGGHGLGLAIVSDICKKYNFDIEVESKNSINTFRYILNI
ncbi:sensor histidine kinase [Aliarcobacter trophiarum]|uniref:sensor histidine kinase n=1 Tax=Aliarcobacter trophiarum TaxID=708186 RepID=UPI00100B2F4F|nr:HAMP domain-containing sensor histidine kinase [Aliarcobacter trophiarum]RXI27771.1 hypothetical protein CRU89_04235 [Aliarcobacter trophiarum]